MVLGSGLSEHETLTPNLLDDLELLEHVVLSLTDLHPHRDSVGSLGGVDVLLDVLQPLLKSSIGIRSIKHVAANRGGGAGGAGGAGGGAGGKG